MTNFQWISLLVGILGLIITILIATVKLSRIIVTKQDVDESINRAERNISNLINKQLDDLKDSVSHIREDIRNIYNILSKPKN